MTSQTTKAESIPRRIVFIKGCRCALCERHHEASERMSRMADADRAFWFRILDALENTELDRDVLQAKLDGTWPTHGAPK